MQIYRIKTGCLSRCDLIAITSGGADIVSTITSGAAGTGETATSVVGNGGSSIVSGVSTGAVGNSAHGTPIGNLHGNVWVLSTIVGTVLAGAGAVML